MDLFSCCARSQRIKRCVFSLIDSLKKFYSNRLIDSLEMTEQTYEQFLAAHEPQLLASAIPVRLWPSLFKKLSEEVRQMSSF